MGVEFYYYAVLLLAGFAIFDLIVGVSNDAVNFLNSSIGSRVAPRTVIMIIASLGLLVGVGFSGGMMEVARKGIFHPEFFTMPELIGLFMAVMITDIMLLDLFNAYGLPTSTTVSIVFELLGAAVALSVLKILNTTGNLSELSDYINTSKAMLIIFGILLSVVVAFSAGALIQILSRLLFTFKYETRLKRYGAVWGGMALASITYFIVVKGAKNAAFIPPESADWIKDNTLRVLLGIFAVSVVLLQLLIFMKVNILKPIVLIGTFALAMAFAANDLVNFIGVPMAGWHAYGAAASSSEYMTMPMTALGGKVAAETSLLLMAGLIMAVTLWVSKKARTVTETTLSLGDQGEREEAFGSFFLSRIIVRMTLNFFEAFWKIVPNSVRIFLAGRVKPLEHDEHSDSGVTFDLLRASVNLMVASALISLATSYKLPLSTTYVTFMVAMGASFADQAWGRESAVYRVTGVLAVVSGWFLTAFMAFSVSCLFAVIIYYTQAYGVFGLLAFAGLVVWRNHSQHTRRASEDEMEKVFNLKKVKDSRETVTITYTQIGHFLKCIRESLDTCLDALFKEELSVLRDEKRKAKQIQRWSNIITANIFKALRLLQKQDVDISYRYGQTARRLQKLTDGHRDMVLRAYHHVSNHHEGFLPDQISELEDVRTHLHEILQSVEEMLKSQQIASRETVADKEKLFRDFAERLNETQLERISEGTSKTRLNILYYAIVGNSLMISKQNIRLLESFEESFSETKKTEYEFELD